MICLEVVGGVVQVVTPQPVNLSACSLVAGSYSESFSGLMQISPEEGSQIAGAILLLWAGAWVVKVIIHALNVADEGEIK